MLAKVTSKGEPINILITRNSKQTAVQNNLHASKHCIILTHTTSGQRFLIDKRPHHRRAYFSWEKN